MKHGARSEVLWLLGGVSALFGLMLLLNRPTVVGDNGYAYGCPNPLRMAFDSDFIDVDVNGSGPQDLPVPSEAEYAASSNAPGVWRMCRSENVQKGAMGGAVLLLVAGGCAAWEIRDRCRFGGTRRGAMTSAALPDMQFESEPQPIAATGQEPSAEPTVVLEQWIDRLVVDGQGRFTLMNREADDEVLVPCRGVWPCRYLNEPAFVVAADEGLWIASEDVAWTMMIDDLVAQVTLHGLDAVDVTLHDGQRRRLRFETDRHRREFFEVAKTCIDQERLDWLTVFNREYERGDNETDAEGLADGAVERIRELAERREAGHITAHEFEARRGEVLSP